MHPRKFVRDSVGYAFAQYVVRATLMLRGLIAARFLGPAAWGSWNAIQMLMDSGQLVTLGTQQGLDQAVPPAIVAGDAGALDRVKRAALFNIALFTAGFMLVCLGAVAAGHSKMLNEWGYLGVGAAVVCALTTNLAFYQTSIMRSHGDIATASRWVATQGAVGGVLGLALMPWLHVWGLLAGWLTGCLVAFALSTRRSSGLAPMAPRFAPESLDLVQTGLPMFMFIASSQILMRMLDRLIILHKISNTDLGYYSLSVMALAFLMYVPDSITFVMYPRLLSVFGESGRDPQAIRPRVERVLLLFSVLLPLLCGVAWLGSRPAVVLLLPKYLPGVDAMRILCFGAVALAYASFASIVLMTVGRQMLLIPAAIFGLALYGGLDWWAVTRLEHTHGLEAIARWPGITRVAAATLVAYTINSAALVMLALAGTASKRVPSAVARLFAPMLLAFVLVLALEPLDFAALHGTATGVLERFIAGGGHPGFLREALAFVVNVAAFLGFYLLAVRPLLKGAEFVRLLGEFNLPVVGPLLRRFRREEA